MLLAPACELADLATVGDGKHLRFRVRRDGATPGGHRVRSGPAARHVPAGRALGRRLPPGGEPLERDGPAAARRAAHLHSGRRFYELRDWLVAEWPQARERRATPDATASSPSSSSTSPRSASATCSSRSVPRAARAARARARCMIRLAAESDWPAILEVHRVAFGDEGDDVARIAQELHDDRPTSPTFRSSPRRTAASSATS